MSAPAWVEGVGLLLAAFPVSIVLLRQPQWAFATWLTVTASLNVLVSQASIDVGFKLYAVDAIFLLASLAALLERGHQGDQAPIFTPRLLLVMCILVAFGLAQTVRGVLAGNAFSDALGTLRRMFFYPVLAFALARVFLRSPRGPHLVQRALWIASGIIGLVFAGRVITGIGYRSDIFAADRDVIRYLSYAEGLTLASGACLALALWALNPSHPRRSRWLATATLLSMLVIASNYRSAWLALLAGLLCTGVALSFRTPGGAFRAMVIGGVTAATGIAALFVTPLGQLLVEKFSRLNLMTTGSWRLFSWVRAWEVFREHPLLGVGLGYHHVFAHFAGDFKTIVYATNNSIHNDGLWVLVNTGVIGFGLFAILALSTVRQGLAFVKRAASIQSVALACATIGGLGACAVTAMLQPTLSLGGTSAWIGTAVALFTQPTQVEYPHDRSS